MEATHDGWLLTLLLLLLPCLHVHMSVAIAGSPACVRDAVAFYGLKKRVLHLSGEQ